MKAEIFSVGTELLLGDIVNTNAQFLSKELAALGFDVYRQSTLGDNAKRLATAIEEALTRADLLVFTGGLGPTKDDLTKETIAGVFEDPLVLDEEVLADIRQRFLCRGAHMPLNNEKQAMVPQNGRHFANENGTAPGVLFQKGEKIAIALPGPPAEMEPMFRNAVAPYLQTLADSALHSLTLRVYGIGESALEGMVDDLLENENPTAALYAKGAEVHIRITAKAKEEKTAAEMCKDYAGKFYQRLASAIYGEDEESLEAAAIHALEAANLSSATAESCTGGMVAMRLTNVPGAGGAFYSGMVTYTETTKHRWLGVSQDLIEKHGVVSAPCAAAMALGILRKAEADIGLSVTGIAGPTGGTPETPVGLVFIGLATKEGVFVRRMQSLSQKRDAIRHSATQQSLDLLRRAAKNLPLDPTEQWSVEEVQKWLSDTEEKEGKGSI